MDKNTGNPQQTSTISGRTHIRKDHDFNMECYLITLYLNYDITEDFQTQFQQNSDAILSLIETLGTVDIPKKS